MKPFNPWKKSEEYKARRFGADNPNSITRRIEKEKYKPSKHAKAVMKRAMAFPPVKPTIKKATPNPLYRSGGKAKCAVCKAPAVASCTSHTKEAFEDALTKLDIQSKDMVCSEELPTSTELQAEIDDIQGSYSQEELFEEMNVDLGIQWDTLETAKTKIKTAKEHLEEHTITKSEYVLQKLLDMRMHHKAARNHYYTGYLSVYICDRCSNVIDMWPSCWQKRYYRDSDCVYCKIEGLDGRLDARALRLKKIKDWDVSAIDGYFIV